MARKKQYRAALFHFSLLFSTAVWANDNDLIASDLVDPTRPIAFVAPSKAAKRAEQLELQAIYVGEKRREAVINGRAVKVGDTVDQAKILTIDTGRVRYAKNGAEGELVLLPRVLQPVQGEE